MSKLAPPTRVSLRYDGTSATEQYVGEASFGSSEADAVWRIKKLTYSGSNISITWADGNDNFDNVWSNRASLSYQ